MAVQVARLGMASTLMALPPVIFIAAEYILYGTRVRWRVIVGTVTVMAGVALIFLA